MLNVWAISTLLSWEPKVIEISIIHQHIISQNKEIPLEQIVFNSEADQKEPNALLWLSGTQTCWKCAVSSQYSRQRGQNRVRLGHLKVLQTGPHQNRVQTRKTHAHQSQTQFLIGDSLQWSLTNQRQYLWKLFRPLGRAEGPMLTPCAYLGSFSSGVCKVLNN